MRKFEFWTIGYRARQGDATLLTDRQTEFRAVPNNWRYWYADPHLFRYGTDTYLFAEAYDRVLRRGVISCCQLTEQGPTPWKVVLKQPCHLSYPHILEKDGEVYMIPETYVADEIAVFRAKQFPEQWEKIAVLKKGGEPVDSTVFHFGRSRWMLTLECTGDKLMLYPLGDEGICGEGFCVTEHNPNARPAGHLFCAEKKLIRPAQDCTESYGCALNFCEVKAVGEHQYEETLLCKLRPEEFQTDLTYKPEGIHTYNFTEEFEVVDFKGYEVDPLFYVMRPVWFIWRRIRKVFGK